MELVEECKDFLFLAVLVVLSFSLLSYVLGKYRYKLHISAKKIEILPSKESPDKKAPWKRA